MLFSLALIFCLRSLLLAFFEANSWGKRLFHLLCALVFACVPFFIQAQFDPTFIFFSALIVAISLILRFYGVLRHNFWIRLVKGVVFGTFALSTAAAFFFSGFLHLTEEREIAKIVVTGKQVKKWAEWKNPDSNYCEGFVDSYEVLLEKPDGTLISSHYVYGDLVAVRAEVVRLRPFLNFLGIPNACRIEAIYNGYRTMERHQRLPHMGLALPFTSSVFSLFWEKLFYLKWKNRWIQASTLESNYFPLVGAEGRPLEATYTLSLSPGGFSAMKN